VEKGLISPSQARARLAGIDLRSVERTRRAAQTGIAPLARGVVAGMGIATGRIALDCDAAARMVRNGSPVILVRQETATSDIEGLANATGILTATGDLTSHAAVVARQLGKVCIVACADLGINLSARVCRIGCRTLSEGDIISLDGNEGEVFAGNVETIVEKPERELAAIAAWAQPAVA
jgi:pyruvate,orthophosphate dikinase